MKKKMLFCLTLICSLLFLQNVKAETCSYQASLRACVHNKSYVDGSECTDTGGSFTEGAPGLLPINSSDSYSKFQIPSIGTNSYKVDFTYHNSKGNKRTLGCDIKNWKSKVNGSNLEGNEVMMSKESSSCPAYMVFRTSTWDSLIFNTCDAWMSSSLENAKQISNNVASGHSNRGYIHIVELKQKSSTDEESSNTSCKSFTDESSCTTNDEYSCLWVEKNVNGAKIEYCNFDDLTYVKCGDAWDIPSQVPGIISFLVNLLKIVTPIILIVVSIITLLKAVASSSEDSIKKAQSGLIKKLIAAAMVFFIVQITQFVILKVADSSDHGNIGSCLSCFLNNDCSKNVYYKTKVGRDYECTALKGSFSGECN